MRLMDLDALRAEAAARLEPFALAYHDGTAGHPDDAERDVQAWRALDLLPRVLRGLTSVEVSTSLLGRSLPTPIIVSPTAGHRLSHPEGEPETAAGTARSGMLYVYSSSASVDVVEFGRRATGPWWAQVYLMQDRRYSDRYLERAVAAGAGAIVFTVDYPGAIGDAAFRLAQGRSQAEQSPNLLPLTWPVEKAMIDPDMQLADIGRIAAATGLPVVVKGILHPVDALAAVDAGAAAVFVSNHGRRQVAGVVPTSVALPGVVAAVAGKVPVLVDGGIRSGVDVLRALCLGAAAVGVGRPVLWGLTVNGADGVDGVLTSLAAELRQAMAAVCAATLADLTPDLLA